MLYSGCFQLNALESCITFMRPIDNPTVLSSQTVAHEL